MADGWFCPKCEGHWPQIQPPTQHLDLASFKRCAGLPEPAKGRRDPRTPRFNVEEKLS